MAGAIGEVPVGVAEGISAPEDEAPPSPPPTEGEISDVEEDDMPSADDIRNATTVVTPLCDLPPGISFRVQDSALNAPAVEAPMLSSNDFIGDQLRNSIALSTKGSEVYNALTSALSVHASEMADRLRKGKASSDLAHNDALVTNSLLRRLKTSSLYDDDEDNDTPAEAAQREVIRKRKTRRLLESKRQESEARNSIMAPSEPLPSNRRLSNHHDFLAVLLWLRDLEEVVIRKDWSSSIEMWVFSQIEKGSKAHTAFHVFLKSGVGLQLNKDTKVYFRDFPHFKHAIIRLFFTKLKDPLAVIEKNIKRIKLSLSGSDGPTTPTTLEGFANTLRFLFNQAPMEAAYPERQQVPRIRERLPKQVESYLLEWEVNNAQIINTFESLMPCLHRQDVLFAETLEAKTSPNTSNKRPATEALQAAEVETSIRRNKRKLDNRLPCSHCHKPGHSIDSCWEKYPDKKRAYNARGRGPPQSVLPLNNITSESLQSMLSKAVDSVLASANKRL
jgi:hypothetical protein